ncbi:uncharacterized protein BJX67DRAFT_373135 [Aspergillus lucknowensis]|uniref:Mid2 domain-containing protein n=1 Tax=Aspergillus lucknowensis TaxID=176173 RepID=A0ABR4LQ46_9EURO
MRSSRALQSAISILTFLSRCQHSHATPFSLGWIGPEKRCDNPCGFYSQLCCTSDQVCITNDDNQAVCRSGSSDDSGDGSGAWEYYTSTYVLTETDVQTMTSVWSSWVASPTSGSCQADLGETKCGSDCCGAAYVCRDDQCVLGATTSIWATETATPPVRPTDSNTVTETATATQGFDAPVTTDGSPAYGVDAPDDGGLSGGAIAGIVIGTLAGVFLLFLLCLCLCARGILHSILACLGIGKRRRTEETYVEDHHSHHAHRPPGRTWFGAGPSGSGHDGEKKSRFCSLAMIGIIVGAIALILGLRKKNDHDEKSDYTYPSYYSYYTSTTKARTDERDGADDQAVPGPGRTHNDFYDEMARYTT